MPDLHAAPPTLIGAPQRILIGAAPRILIVRLGAMGDILHALPAVTALRAAHPEWHLGWAIEPRWRALLCAASKPGDGIRNAAMPLVDRIHNVSARQWGRNLHRAATVSEIMAIGSELREQRYDIALDLQGAVRSAIFGLWSQAPRRIGEATPREYPARFFFNERIATHSAHVIDQDCEVASAIAGEPLTAVPPLLPVDQDAETRCDQWLDALPVSSPGANLKSRFILMNPGAGWGAKRWPVERYGQVAARLHSLGYVVLINTGPDEKLLAQALIEASGNTAVSMEFDLTMLITITRRAALMIAGDTGPLHLASALGKPVVGIFGPTDPARNGPYAFEHSSYRILRSPQSRRDHSRRVAPEAGLLTITPEAVFAAAVDLLHEGQALLRESVPQ